MLLFTCKTLKQFLVIATLLFTTYGFINKIDAVFTVPNCVKSSSQLEIVSQGTATLYSIEEFLDIEEASIRLVVSNDATPNYADDYTSYFRINEKNVEAISDKLLAFSHRDQLCKVGLIQNWRLSKLTDYLLMLYESYKFVAPSVEVQSISIGPTALLQFIKTNAALFILRGELFVDSLLKDMYMFEARDYSTEGSTVIVITCLIPKAFVNDEDLKLHTSSLGELKSDAFPRSIMVTELNSTANFNHLDAKELYEFNNLSLDRLKIEFDIVHERAADNYRSLDLGTFDFRNPFKIPGGSGCLVAPEHNLLKVGAQQFSGTYEAKDMLSQRYIAFDGDTGTLRLDSVNEYKLIYNLKTKKIIYIPKADVSKCISMNLRGKDADKSLTSVKTMEDVMGFDKQLPLVYLGTAQLEEDGTHCVVFEREIYPDQIPLLVKLNMRLRVYSNARVFLTYYFTTDININSYSDPQAYRGLWLKRVELLMMISVSKYKLLCSQITFSQSTWDLESIGGETSLMFHPARTFDTLECFSIIQQEQTHVEMALKEEDLSDWLGTCDELTELDEAIEEGAIRVISHQLSISRDQINEIELKIHDGTYNTCVFQLNYVLLNHLPYVYESSHIGWIDNMNSDLFKMHVKVLIQQEGLIMSECFLKYTAEYQDHELRDAIAMVHCVGPGFCGYLNTSELSLLDFYAKDETRGSQSGHICEVHKMIKSQESNQVIDDKLTRINLERALSKAYLPIQLETHDLVTREIRCHTLRIKATSVIINKGGATGSLGTLVARQQCYSNETYLENSSMGNMNISNTELTFDIHHTILYCHRACQMSPNCITYSYSSSDRKCTLSNIPLGLLSQLEDLKNMKSERSCRIYLLNSMYLFESVNIIIFNLLSRLAESTQNSYYITRADREKCANLCHWNTLYCNEFYHSVEDQVCAFEDQNQSLYKLLHVNQGAGEKYEPSNRLQFFKQQIGSELWDKSMTLHLFKTDYSHFYTKKQSSRVDYSVVQPIGGNLIQITSLYDLSYSACLRECTIKRSECVIVDYCKTNLDSNCKLFTTYDKYLFTLDQITLDDLVALDKNVTTPSSICTHHFLKPDSFSLKRQLFLTSSQVRVEVKGDLERIDDEIWDEKRSKYEWKSEGITVESVLKIVSLLIGIVFGFILLSRAANLPSNSSRSSRLGEYISVPVRYIRSKNWINPFQDRRNRSESVAQLELEVVKEEDN